MVITELDGIKTLEEPARMESSHSSCGGTLTTFVPSAPDTASATALLRDLLDDPCNSSCDVSLDGAT